jgi:hypothetical protein
LLLLRSNGLCLHLSVSVDLHPIAVHRALLLRKVGGLRRVRLVLLTVNARLWRRLVLIYILLLLIRRLLLLLLLQLLRLLPGLWVLVILLRVLRVCLWLLLRVVALLL